MSQSGATKKLPKKIVGELNQVRELATELDRLYRIEGSLEIGKYIENYENRIKELEKYEEELKTLIKEIRQFENHPGDYQRFLIRLDEHLLNISLHQIGEESVRPQHLFFKEAKAYQKQGEISKAQNLGVKAVETIQILEEMNKHLFKLLEMSENSFKQSNVDRDLKPVQHEAKTKKTVEKLEKEKKRTKNMFNKKLDLKI